MAARAHQCKLNGVGKQVLKFSRELFKDAVEIPGAATDALGQACRDANIIAVVAILPGSTRSLAMELLKPTAYVSFTIVPFTGAARS